MPYRTFFAILCYTVVVIHLTDALSVSITPATSVSRPVGSTLLLTCTVNYSPNEASGQLQLARTGKRRAKPVVHLALAHQPEQATNRVLPDDQNENSLPNARRVKRQADRVYVSWFKQSESRVSISSNPNERPYTELEQFANKLKLIFSPLRDIDSGVYICLANRGGKHYQSTVNITVTQPTQVKKCDEKQDIKLNAASSIICEAVGHPTPTTSWFFKRPDSNVFEFLGRYNGAVTRAINKAGSVTRNSLELDQVSLSDEGTYEVRFEIEAIGDFQTRRIDARVAVPPSIEQTRHDQNALQGSSTELQCDAVGTPAPTVSWFRKEDTSAELDSSLSSRYKVNKQTGKLTISQLMPNDTGDYVCRASNSVGNVTASISVEVKTIPKIIRLLPYQTSLANKSVTIKCVASGSPPLDLRLLKINQETNQVTDLSESHLLESRINIQTSLPTPYDEPDCDVRNRYCKQQVLTIVMTQPSDAANYTCVARNDAGSTNQTSILEIFFGPMLNKTETKVFAYDDIPAKLTCIAYGKPIPEFYWQKLGWPIINVANITYVSQHSSEQHIQLSGNSRNYRVTMEYYPLYTVSNVEVTVNSVKDDRNLFGNYRCSVAGRGASNYAVDSHTIELAMAGPPKAPVNCSITMSTASFVRLGIEPPNDTGGFPLTGYTVNFRLKNLDGSLSPTSSDPALFKMGELIELRGLRPRTEYRFQVAARNRIGVGAQTECVYVTPDVSAPSTPEITSQYLSNYSRSYELRWKQENDGGLPLSQYALRIRQTSNVTSPGDETLKYPSASSNSMVLYSLQPGTVYEVELSAINTEGLSAPAVFRFQTLPETNVTISAVVETTTVLPKWVTLGIISGCAFITLIVIDVTCYFWKACGFTHTFCIMCCDQDKRQVKTQYNFEAAERRYLMTLERSRDHSRATTPLAGVSPSVERKDLFSQSTVHNNGSSKSADLLVVDRRGDTETISVPTFDSGNKNGGFSSLAAAQIHAAPQHNLGNGSANNHSYYQ